MTERLTLDLKMIEPSKIFHRKAHHDTTTHVPEPMVKEPSAACRFLQVDFGNHRAQSDRSPTARDEKIQR